MPIPNYKKFLSEDPLADSDSSDSDYDPNSAEQAEQAEEEEEYEEDYDNLKEKIENK